MIRVDSDDARLVLGADTASRFAIPLPGTVRVLWDAKVYERRDGSRYTAVQGLTMEEVFITGGITGMRQRLRYDSGSDRWHRAECGDTSLWSITLPEERKVSITSDPEGASIFHSPYEWSVPEFIGTTPRDLVVLWHPGQQGVSLLFQKSGHQGVRRRLAPSDTQMRIILHPTPEVRRSEGR